MILKLKKSIITDNGTEDFIFYGKKGEGEYKKLFMISNTLIGLLIGESYYSDEDYYIVDNISEEDIIEYFKHTYKNIRNENIKVKDVLYKTEDILNKYKTENKKLKRKMENIKVLLITYNIILIEIIIIAVLWNQ